MSNPQSRPEPSIACLPELIPAVQRLHKRTRAALLQNLAPGEGVEVIVWGAANQTMVASLTRVFVCKPGWLAGAWLGAEVTPFVYDGLSGAQMHLGALSGAVVLQGSGLSGSGTNYWSHGNDDPHRASNAIPVVRHPDLSRTVAELNRLIQQSRGQAQARARSVAPPESPVSSSLADELSKLAALHSQGILTAQEFETAKARVIAGAETTAP